MIDTILFDLDGTLLDTNELIIQSFHHAMKTHNLAPLLREDIISQMGNSLFDQIALFSKQTEIEHILNSYREFNISKHDEMVIIFPHVKEALAALHGQGIKLGIVTSKIRLTVERGLELFDLMPYFTTIVPVDEVSQPKPHPEGILLALKRLNSKAENTLMVGDSQYDMLAAQGANVRSVGVEWSIQGVAVLNKYNPTYLIKSMLDLQELVAADASTGADTPLIDTGHRGKL